MCKTLKDATTQQLVDALFALSGDAVIVLCNDDEGKVANVGTVYFKRYPPTKIRKGDEIRLRASVSKIDVLSRR